MSDTRADLLTCALRLFVAYGYDGVGVQQIVEAAGVTKPTLYHHFGSKLGLLQTLLAEQLAEFGAALGQAAAYRHDLTFTLGELARVSFAFARSHAEMYRLSLMLWFAPQHSEAHEAVLPFHVRRFEALERLFKDASVDHGNIKGRHRAYAASFLGMLDNAVSMGLNDYTALNDALARQAVHQFMHGIFS